MMNNHTVERLRAMRLKGMADAFADQMKRPESQSFSFEERFGMIVDYEYTSRQNRRLNRLLTDSKMRIPACVEDIDFQQPRGIDRNLIKRLATCQWIDNHQNVLITGPTGVGKTFLACALTTAACRHGLRSRYFRAPRLLSEMAVARGDGSYTRLLGQLAKIELLVLDDWGLAPFTDVQGRDLLEIIDDRSQSRSLIISSQLPVENWHATLPDPSLADAILDRVIHNAHKITLKGDSMRRVIGNRSVKEKPDS